MSGSTTRRSRRRHLLALASATAVVLGSGIIVAGPTTPVHAQTACSVDFSASQWGDGAGGFTASVTITASGVNGWQLQFALPGGAQIVQGWSANWSQSGQSVTASDLGWNANLGQTSVGFNGTGYAGDPTSFTLNGVACNGGTPPPPPPQVPPPPPPQVPPPPPPQVPPPPPPGTRPMENLDRGVVAVRSSNSQVLVRWRLLGLDPDGIGFNVYRATGSGQAVRINNNVLTGATNFVDSSANLSQANTYHVRPVISGTEQAASGTFTLPANNPVEPVVRVPIRSGGPIKFLWVGDLTGDGEYDFVIDRQTTPQRIEAYRRDGTFLWDVDLGPNSTNQNNISPGSSTVNVGHNDGVTVFDFNSDGRAEVAIRIANGVRFGDGQTFSHPNNNVQFVAFLDGQTGALRAAEQIPTDYLSYGPLAVRFGVGYLDGVRPHLIAYKKNRLGGAGTGFNLMQTAWTFDGNSANMEWKWLRGNQNAPDGHNSRSIDVSGDGRDEVVEQGFVLNGDGSLRYSLGPQGVVHGDRFHIAKMDPNRPGLQGYQVQQDNPNGLREFYYDAGTGNILWRNTGPAPGPDVGRGMVGPIDPRFTGMEMWSFFGIYNATTLQLTEPNTNLRPWPHLGFWWDGELTMDLLNDGKFEKWTPLDPRPTNSLQRLLSTWHFGAVNASQGINPLFYGDILGDWREEAIYANSSNNELIIFSTNHATDIRLYTRAHNPAYRNAMTFKGYMQSHHVDYYLGPGMQQPPRPDIHYVGS